MKLLILLCLAFVSLEGKYVACLEGGGTKTLLQVLDEKGSLVYSSSATGSNINTVGVDGVRAVFRTLFQDATPYLAECEVVAGMAGVALPANKEKVVALFEELGVSKEKIFLTTDAELALKLIKGEGIVLISGTGSICFGQKGETRYRVGGLGKILGDEGSGYQIGLNALRAALAEEYGWGEKTQLTAALRDHFHVPEIKSLIPSVNRGEMLASEIGSAAPLVFALAKAKDRAAQKIVQDAAHALRQLLVSMVETSHLGECELHLWGGVFKSPEASAFIHEIVNDPRLENLAIMNDSHQNAAALFAQQFVLSKE